MSAKRLETFRAGDMAEDLGILLLKGLGFVAPVPRTEDTGIDAIVTLARRDEATANLFADDSFWVQLKARRVRTLKFAQHDYEWLLALRIPYFIGSVDLARAELSLYTMQHVWHEAAANKYTSLKVYLDHKKNLPCDVDCGHVYLGPPVLKWTIADLAKREMLAEKYAAMKPHVAAAYKSIRYRSIGTTTTWRWETGEAPSPTGTSFSHRKQDNQTLRAALREMELPLQALGSDAIHRKDQDDLATVLALVALSRKHGINPDPQDSLQGYHSQLQNSATRQPT